MPEAKRQAVVQAREAGTGGRQLPATKLCGIVVQVLRTIPLVERSKRAERVLGTARNERTKEEVWCDPLCPLPSALCPLAALSERTVHLRRGNAAEFWITPQGSED